MADPQHRVVVTTDRPARRRAFYAAVVALSLLGAFGLYRYSRASAVSDFEAATGERDRLIDERRQLTRELRVAKAEADSLRNQVAYLSRSQQIDDNACVAVKQSLSRLQAESADLREQLAFYRGIVSPQESQAGVRVYEFRITALKTARNAYRYDLVLIQPVRSEKRVGGQAQVVIEGLRNRQKQRLKLSDVAMNGDGNLLFSFKYFEEFSGELRLPADFRPLRILVSLQPGGDGKPGLEDEYEWAKILQETDEP
ncbi:MAG: hypothetical protein NTW01_16740 [Gammaproteobacteria bacterium]|jgi:hypothetical protein|uniref:DUF6776 family protein n=1 Tax=Nevskia sp. TaxID=1929292 RepID=UPI004036599A|nr:hypothetical protein [Gammaproteobacteria bacterium]